MIVVCIAISLLWRSIVDPFVIRGVALLSIIASYHWYYSSALILLELILSKEFEGLSIILFPWMLSLSFVFFLCTYKQRINWVCNDITLWVLMIVSIEPTYLIFDLGPFISCPDISSSLIIWILTFVIKVVLLFQLDLFVEVLDRSISLAHNVLVFPTVLSNAIIETLDLLNISNWSSVIRRIWWSLRFYLQFHSRGFFRVEAILELESMLRKSILTMVIALISALSFTRLKLWQAHEMHWVVLLLRSIGCIEVL